MSAKPTRGTRPHSSHAFSQKPAIDAQRLARLATEEAYQFIRNLPYEGEEKQYLLNLLHTRLEPPWDTANHCTVVLGRTGQGKTSTINSVTGHDLGNAIGGTSSVTNIVMEFRQCYNGQKTPFLVQIFLYSKPYVIKMFEEGLLEYRQWRSTQPETNDGDDSDDEDIETAEAPTRLTTMILDLKFLRQEQGFSDHDAAEQFLERFEDVEILRLFKKWIDHLYRAIQGGDAISSKIEKGYATVDAVKRFIAPFVRKASEPFAEGTDAECCPYPLVEKVVIASRSEVLDKGNIIKDAPGVGDTNKAYVDRAYKALRDADKIMIVSEMKRCLAKNEVLATIKTALKRRGPGNVLLEIEEKIKTETRRRFTREERQTYASLERQIAQINKELQRLKEQEEYADELTTKRELERQIWGKKKKRNELGNAEFELHVVARNQQTIVDFRGKLLSKKIWKKNYPKLVIICIDNEEHNKYAQGFLPWTPDERDEAPRLSQEATGIPALRRIIEDFPADGRWAILKHHIYETWDCTMNSLEMSGTVSMAQRKAEVDEQFAGSCQSIVTDIVEQFQGLMDGYVECAKDHMVQKETSWTEGGVRNHADFQKSMKPATHQSLMKKHGLTTTAMGEFDLNEKLYEEPRKVILTSLDDLSKERIPQFFTELIQGIRGTVEGLFNEFERESILQTAHFTAYKAFHFLFTDKRLIDGPQYDSVGLSAKVQAGMRVRQRRLETTCIAAQRDATRIIRDIHDRAFETHGKYTYFYTAFKPAYDAANGAQKIKKKTLHYARCKAFEQALTVPDGPYYQLHTTIFEELIEHLENLREKLIHDIKSVLGEIQHEINMACSRKDDNSPEAKAFRREVMGQNDKLRELFANRIRPCLDEAVKMSREQRAQERANERTLMV
ncbi:uncharacterized protein N0V89_000195 [Didymosphaeria variabile]|uniref:P-loop containing nucleoside triphosphate hydrolase protein n=1 Tax=Didymosphaeria variabile TaxID=1932322 RepID=A0A9W8XWA0_9PLEO|nr:uncharacterized protein N0V89_000195 [Didymosphaeria variabile]KAJ4359640.1 hypothetical protein N0V89_000195 [Didymosphaeria variabile]